MKLHITKTGSRGKWIWSIVNKDGITIAQSTSELESEKEAEDDCYTTVGELVSVLIKKGLTSNRRLLRDWF